MTILMSGTTMTTKPTTKRKERPPKKPISYGTPWEGVGSIGAFSPIDLSLRNDNQEPSLRKENLESSLRNENQGER